MDEGPVGHVGGRRFGPQPATDNATRGEDVVQRHTGVIRSEGLVTAHQAHEALPQDRRQGDVPPPPLTVSLGCLWDIMTTGASCTPPKSSAMMGAPT